MFRFTDEAAAEISVGSGFHGKVLKALGDARPTRFPQDPNPG